MLLPLGVDDTGKKFFPSTTVLLLLLNIGAYIFCAILGCVENGYSLERVGALPDSVLADVALYPAQVVPSSFIASPWIHLDILHLLGNLLFVWVFGVAAEAALGATPVFWIYLACGFGSVVAQYSVAYAGLVPGEIGYVGSSGAVIGLILTFAVRRYRARVRVWLLGLELRLPMAAALGVFFLWYGVAPNFLAQDDGGSGYWGHLGGAVVGLILALALRMGARGEAEYSLEDAQKLIARGELKSGLKELEALQRNAPDDAGIAIAIARTYLKVWDKPAAARQFGIALGSELAAGRVDQAAAIWREARAAKLSLLPEQVMALAAAAAKAGNDALARTLYHRVASAADEPMAKAARRRLEEMGPGSRT